ncbi:MAG: peptidoglycan DD-metalloendopeptidase family protein [Balneola sp.]|nr:peptidoglycan DD-metalloendopeptidase family protein [Balneola sp.]MBO6651310.1 peptidoglycan DD-metalloendopeptidase family protein [Balneola sp.]MBO6710814.1 peptidoglycan DD-metalloendopeptidase family protein [Balneola sp.]MBO6799501.1 peptidoglycan DD-metalloendopeptidase family protein [Balneola sp.]MBO6870233.1 peptidoglycan DD-metalloendopeptidase family protein [Balneola sp.]
MKWILLFSFSLLSSVNIANAQFLEPDGGGSVDLPSDHLSTEQRAEIMNQLEVNIDSLKKVGKLVKAGDIDVRFSWPLRAESHLFDYGYHGVSNFVDLNSGYPRQLKDYTCGTRTYDTDNGYNHAGTDFFTWPFAWNKMDNGEVAVVAGAPGVIIYSSDGNDDRSCSFNSRNWNAVYIQHSDGSVAWYGHLKRNSLTSKRVGEEVEEGEYLGIVGSSGNSTGPHLHFELHDEDGAVVDPFKGSCNQIAGSLWKSQPDYYDSEINALRTHSSGPSFNQCPEPETPNYKDGFLVGEEIVTTAYYRDQLQGQNTTYKIITPSETNFRSWNHASNEVPHYAASYWYWLNTLSSFAETGLWKFEAQFQGKSYSHYFTVSDPDTKPIPVYLQSPQNDTGVTEETQLLRWLPLADADEYELLISKDEMFNNIVVSETSLLNREYVFGNLQSNNIYYWKVRARNTHGTGEWSQPRMFNTGLPVSIEEEEIIIPGEHILLQNYPNPFNPTTQISYKLSHTTRVELKVYNLLGEEVATLENSQKRAGIHTVTFDASGLSSGIYYYSLRTTGFVEMKPMTLIK